MQTYVGEKRFWIRIISDFYFLKCLLEMKLLKNYSSERIPFHLVSKYFPPICILTAKWIQDRSIFYSKFPMHDNVDLRVCKICKGKYEHEIVFATKIWKKKHFRFALVSANITKHLNNQTSCPITLEKMKKVWICLLFIKLYEFWPISKPLKFWSKS